MAQEEKAFWHCLLHNAISFLVRFYKSAQINKKMSRFYDARMTIVIGPIADDAVGVQVRQLSRGYISFDKFLERIKYIKPTIQYFFGTETSIQYLTKL